MLILASSRAFELNIDLHAKNWTHIRNQQLQVILWSLTYNFHKFWTNFEAIWHILKIFIFDHLDHPSWMNSVAVLINICLQIFIYGGRRVKTCPVADFSSC